MTRPNVPELPHRLEPVTHDPFIDALGDLVSADRDTPAHGRGARNGGSYTDRDYTEPSVATAACLNVPDPAVGASGAQLDGAPANSNNRPPRSAAYVRRRNSISAGMIALALALSLVGCAGGGEISKLGEAVGRDASRGADAVHGAWQNTQEPRQIRGAVCRSAKNHKFSTPPGEDSSGAQIICP